MDLGNGRHLTYCLNIHAGEHGSDQLRAIREHATAVRDIVAPKKPFGLGLRLGRQAADDLEAPGALEAFRQLLDRERLYVLTVNGFPYGRFHRTRIKEQVYEPDWRTYERLEYTRALADLLADMIEPDAARCISTVPVGYRSHLQADADITLAVCHLARTAEYLAMIEKETGRHIVLALEPEPDCLLDDAESTVHFITERLRPEGARYLAKKSECSDQQAFGIIRRHIGVCLDTCHALTLFESPADTLRRLLDADIAVPKIQISASLKCRLGADTRESLRAFADETYLHQTAERTGEGEIIRHADLPEALERGHDGSELRVHTHVPLPFRATGDPTSTADALSPEFFSLARSARVPVMEIETYTFDVLPDNARRANVVESIAEEYRWFLKRWEQASI